MGRAAVRYCTDINRSKRSRDFGGTLSKYLLKLYVTGSSPRAETAIANLRRICEEDLSGEYELEIIDVLEKPEIAESDKILATPTLIKQLPPPLRRVIGDLSDKDKVLLGLEVRSTPRTRKGKQ
jgi:circadian clock protein KaiB